MDDSDRLVIQTFGQERQTSKTDKLNRGTVKLDEQDGKLDKMKNREQMYR
jgi:hypothetical protein